MDFISGLNVRIFFCQKFDKSLYGCLVNKKSKCMHMRCFLRFWSFKEEVGSNLLESRDVQRKRKRPEKGRLTSHILTAQRSRIPALLPLCHSSPPPRKQCETIVIYKMSLEKADESILSLKKNGRNAGGCRRTLLKDLWKPGQNFRDSGSCIGIT